MVADDFYFIDRITLEPQATFSEWNQTIYKNPLQITPSFYVKQSNTAWGTGIGPGFLNPMIRRSLLEEHGIRYREGGRVGKDGFFYLDCLIPGARFYFQLAPHCYLVRPGSLCHRDDESLLERFRYYQRELAETLHDERLNSDPELKASLAEKLSDCQRKLQYRIMIDLFRRKRYLRAILQSFKNPLFFVDLFQIVPVRKLLSDFT
ncbi:MAG: hypothetical protein AB4050_06550 [Synechococcus sp.]